MPITPFHFGPGAAVHAIAPRYVSFLSFCASNVLIDIEPLYYMLTGQYPLHRFFHTYIGAAIITVSTVFIFTMALKLAQKIKMPNVFGWKNLTFPSIFWGSFIGSYSHIIFDSIMHSDIVPLSPFSDSNPMYRIISLQNLHWFCIFSCLFGLIVLGIRRMIK